MPLYRHEAKVIFFAHIPKTGGTSIEKSLKKAGAAEALKFKKKRPYSKSTLQHMHASVYLEAVGDRFADYSFTVVRNPFDRFASEYKMKVLDAGEKTDVYEWAKINLERFFEYPYTRDNHIRPQVDFVSRRLEVFRFENGLDKVIGEACSQLGLDTPEILHEKKGSRGLLPVKQETLDLISSFYKKDFYEFGYSPKEYSRSFEVIG